MKVLHANNIAFMTTLSAVSFFAQSSELLLSPELSSSPESGMQHVTTVAYKNAASKNMWVGEAHVEEVSSLRDTAKSLFAASSIHSNALSLNIPRTGLLMANDNALLSVYAPMKTVNGALSLAGYVSESRVDDSVVRLVQVLSLLATRQINAELKYSVRLDSHSSVDSAVFYRLNLGSDAINSGPVVSVRYHIKF